MGLGEDARAFAARMTAPRRGSANEHLRLEAEGMVGNKGRAPGSENEPPAKVSSGPAEPDKSAPGAVHRAATSQPTPSAAAAPAKNSSATGSPSVAGSGTRTGATSQGGASASPGGSRPAMPSGGGSGPSGGTGGGGKPTAAGGGGGGAGSRPASPPPSSRGGGGGGWTKGLIGGLVGGAAAWAGVNYGLEQPTPQIERLQAQIDEVAAGGGGEAAGFDPSALTARIDDLEARLAEAQAQGGEGGTDPATQEALGTIESRLDELSSRVEQAEASVETATTGSGAGEQVAELNAQVADLQGDIENQLEGLSGRVDGVQGKVDGYADRIEALSSRLEALEAEIESTKAQIDQAGVQHGSAAAIALATGRVRQAIVAGEPFAEDLEPLRPLAERDPVVGEALDGLAPASESGVDTMAELRIRFHEIANDIVHETQAPEGDHPLNKAAGSLMKLVSVRAIGGDVEGEHAEAIVARTEAKLEGDDLEGALAELDGMAELPEAAAAWRVRADARLQALAAQERLEAHATELLEKARS